MFIGQSKLQAQINSLPEIPQFILLVGEKHSGRNHIIDIIASKINAYKLTYKELKIGNVRELIEDCYSLNKNTLYYLENGDEMTSEAQNGLLKVAEEPPNHCYIVLSVSNLDRILPTITSRAVVLYMNNYSYDELVLYAQQTHLSDLDMSIYYVATTPGNLLRLAPVYNELYSLCSKLYQNIGIINYANLLKLTGYLDLKKNDEAKFQVIDFLNTLGYLYENNGDFSLVNCDCLQLISEAENNLKIRGSNYQMIVDILLLNIKEVSIREQVNVH